MALYSDGIIFKFRFQKSRFTPKTAIVRIFFRPSVHPVITQKIILIMSKIDQVLLYVRAKTPIINGLSASEAN